MGRRFRRIRWLAQQVVTVIRRLWRVCQCCGKVTADVRLDVVPLAAVLANSKAARLQPESSQKSTGFCCHCWGCSCFMRQSRCDYRREELSGCDLTERENVLTASATSMPDTEVAHLVCKAADRPPSGSETSKDNVGGENLPDQSNTSDESCHEVAIQQRCIESRDIFEVIPHNVLALNRADSAGSLDFFSEETAPSIRSSSSDSSCGSYQTDDNVALRFYAGSPVQRTSSQTGTILPTSSQTDDIVAIRYLYPRPNQMQRISSQTDDMVALRYYSRLPQIPTTSSQTDDMVGMRFYPRPSQMQQISTQTMNMIYNIMPQSSSQTDDFVPMRYYPRSSSVPRVSSQTDDIVAMRFHAEVSRIFNRPSGLDETVPVRCNSLPSGLFAVSSQTDDDVAMRYLSGPVRLLAMSSQTDDHVAMRFYNDCLHGVQIDDQMFRTAPTDLYRISSQTDDIVAMRFLTEPPRVVNLSSQTDDHVARRFYDHRITSISTTSQTDDFVAMRYYRQQLQSTSKSSQTDNNVAMRFCSVQDRTSPDTQHPSCSTDFDLPASSQSFHRDAGQYPWRGRGNPVPDTEDSSTSIEVRRRHWNVKEPKLSADDPGSAQVRSLLTLKFPLSDMPVPPVTKPDDLTVEFAIVDEWHRIYPVEWTKIQNIARTRTGSVDLTILGEYNRQIALKTLNAETSNREAGLLIDCQGPFVVQLCACMVQGNERFLCMTYYNRRDLSQWLNKDPHRKYFKEREGTWLLAYIIAGVNFLHKKNIIHVDIKPANILIDNKGYPVVGDFGSAMRTDGLNDFVAYTPAYAAPEIHNGETPDRQSDLWSVACIFYEIIMKRVPYIGKFTMETELRVSLGVALEASSMSIESRDYLCSELKLKKEDRLGFKGTTRRVMHHAVFKYIHWSEIKHRSRKLECRLFEVFRQMERDEFNRRNKPDPIPPDSVFYRPWSYYIKQQQSLKAVESATNDCQIPGPSGVHDANSPQNSATMKEFDKIEPTTTERSVAGAYPETDIHSQPNNILVQISSQKRGEIDSQGGHELNKVCPERVSTTVREAAYGGDSGTDVDYKPSHVLFHCHSHLDICDVRHDTNGAQNINGNKQSEDYPRKKFDQPAEVMDEYGQSAQSDSCEDYLKDVVDQT